MRKSEGAAIAGSIGARYRYYNRAEWNVLLWGAVMGEELNLSRDLAESVAGLQFPPSTNQRLQDLMDRNNDGKLTATERQELESLAAMSESIALLRAKALRFLGRKAV